MTNQLKLSDGSLDLILEQRNQNLQPIVQILGAKMMANNRLRAVVFDGRTICQHCIMVSEEIESLFQEGQLDKFTIIRLQQYSVSSIPKKDNIPVILVQQLEILQKGEEIGRKLDPDESISLSAGNTSFNNGSNVATASSSTSNRNTMNVSMNQSISSAASNSAQKKPRISDSDNVDIRPENVCPISVLTPFYNAWTIRALCVHKSPLRTYSNQRGQGRVFNFDVCDDTGEIRVTCFNDECDRFYDLIQKDRCYFIGRGMIKSANKKFSSVNNDYEISLTSNSFVKPCVDNQIEAPKLRYKFIPLSRIVEMEANNTVDVIGVIRSVGELDSIISRKTSKELLKREVVIVDKSLAEARLTLWGEQAQTFDGQPNQVLALKGASIGDFKGKTLSARDSTNIVVDPDLPEKDLLTTWYSTLDPSENFNQLSKSDSPAGSNFGPNYRFIAQIIPKKIQSGETLNFQTVATVQAFSRIQNHLYKSCGQNNCQKKVSDNDGSGTYHCSKCDRTSAVFEWRLMVNVMLTDVSGSFWVTLFQEQAEKLLGKSVAELSRLYEEDQNLYIAALDEIRFKQFNFRIYTRLDTYNEEIRMRHTAGQVYELKPKAFIKNLMRSIENLSRQL
ncbi:60S acidic ribosomal protein P1 [Dermatophagoides pteronyssinus]|uniref:Replication protein A subunit n=2 Tax=Dermatophagoides pteronyssinus TaxID=6956 RepID=A0A6P6XPA7_DERPT|nr:replication protein A 70 kDa DNA-binding subunit-like [Dermatophagoides pteronyssinus]KAH9425869.1 60S acidic ribosomal protein P1 [Dermatophagoides pteronyssinus]